ncbi:MAG TPA: glycosyltransferase [Lutibacter sp.]|nr:glycosyltransferase [Lutibacter sp.]
MSNPVHISVVTPVYGCSKSLAQLYIRLEKTLSTITNEFEIIMVNDASPDNAWESIKELAAKDSRVKGINFSRNFGQHRAITAGLDYAKGDWVVVMDCDLQDQPEEIIKLYNKAQEGYDVVFGKRENRQDKWFKRLGSKAFYLVYNYFTESNTNGQIGNFSIISKKVSDELKKFNENSRPYALMVNWLGFNRANIEIKHEKRTIGQSSYSLSKLLTLATDIIISHSNKPLQITIRFGFLLSFIAFSYGLWILIRYYTCNVTVEGWTTVVVSIFFMGGIIIASLGIVGLYIGRIYDETKNRPFYTIEQKTFTQGKK